MVALIGDIHVIRAIYRDPARVHRGVDRLATLAGEFGLPVAGNHNGLPVRANSQHVAVGLVREIQSTRRIQRNILDLAQRSTQCGQRTGRIHPFRANHRGNNLVSDLPWGERGKKKA